MNSNMWTPLVVPENVPSVIKASYELTREALEKLVSEWKGTNVVIPGLNLADGIGHIQGSNFYFASELFNNCRELSGEQDILPLSQEKAEYTLKIIGDSLFRENYQNMGLAVRPGEGYNYVLHKHLVEMVRSESGFQDIDLEIPFVVTGAMKPVKDGKFEYGLKLDPNEFTIIYNAPILGERSGYFNPEDINEETGLPIRLRKKGQRRLQNISTGGVCWLNRSRSLYLYARHGGLALSNVFGRVYFAKNFSKK